MYTVGWAKRGPSGVIGTNKSDASEVMKLLVADLPAVPKDAADTAQLPSDHRIVTQTDWEKINAAEVASGEALGKPRVKAATRKELFDLAGL